MEGKGGEEWELCLARVQVQRSGGHPVFFRPMDHFTYQYKCQVGNSVWKPLWTFLQKLTHVRAVYTRPSFPSTPLEGLGMRPSI